MEAISFSISDLFAARSDGCIFILLLYAIMTKSRKIFFTYNKICLLYTSPSPRDRTRSRMPSSA